ncbi:MAG: DUF1080 domain-containing protein [Planctomycetes bacterium]|nr:DUF1080 domain-containing protein [Planctomycetota bacterium]
MIRAVIAVSLTLLAVVSGCSTGTPLFNGQDTSGWVEIGSRGAWRADAKDMCPARGPALTCSGQHDGYAWLSTDRKYGDFELTLDWRVNAGGNTGVFCRAPDREGRTSMKGFEVQACDDSKEQDPTQVSGGVFNRIPAAGRFAKLPGQWNHLKITCRGRHLRVELNGRVTVDADMDAVPAKGNDPPMKNVPNEGYIGLQNHGTLAEFRDIRIRELR